MGAVVQRGTEPMLIMECMDHGSLYDLLHNDTVGGLFHLMERSSRFTMPCVMSLVQPHFLLFNPAMLIKKCMDDGSFYDLLRNDTIPPPQAYWRGLVDSTKL